MSDTRWTTDKRGVQPLGKIQSSQDLRTPEQKKSAAEHEKFLEELNKEYPPSSDDPKAD